jgi:hypothetical protein
MDGILIVCVGVALLAIINMLAVVFGADSRGGGFRR